MLPPVASVFAYPAQLLDVEEWTVACTLPTVGGCSAFVIATALGWAVSVVFRAWVAAAAWVEGMATTAVVSTPKTITAVSTSEAITLRPRRVCMGAD